MKNNKPSQDSIIRLVIPLAGTALTRDDILSIGNAMKTMARKAGGSGRVILIDQLVQVDLQGLSQEEVQKYIAAWGEYAIKRSVDFRIVVTIVPMPRLPVALLPGEFLRKTLTKKLLFSLPNGVCVTSNLVVGPEHNPVWAAKLTIHTDRQRLWEDAAARGATHRIVSVFWKKKDALPNLSATENGPVLKPPTL